jgi:hypothetical protein
MPEGERIGADEDDDEQHLQARGLPGFTVPLAFLKQIRSIEDGTRAAHQSMPSPRSGCCPTPSRPARCPTTS